MDAPPLFSGAGRRGGHCHTGWSQDAVVDQVPRLEHLDDLVELGVTHVELMPIAQFPGVHGWGYDGVDLYAAHAPYGGPSGLRDLIAECHARGLAVIITDSQLSDAPDVIAYTQQVAREIQAGSPGFGKGVFALRSRTISIAASIPIPRMSPTIGESANDFRSRSSR